MAKKETSKRYILFIISLFFIGLGIAFTKCGELGVSPISSVANILSLKFTYLSMGSWLIVTNCTFVVCQILILRKNFKPIQLLQFPLSFLFGYFTDFGMLLAKSVPVNSYIMQLVMVISGIIILGFGISLSVIANVIMNAGEALVKTLSDVMHRNFGNVKIFFDVSCVVLSIILSLIFFNFKIVGTREGTLIAAFLTGITVKIFTKLFKSPLERLLTK